MAELAAVGKYLYARGNSYSGVAACAGCHGKDAHGTETLSLISYQTFQQNRLVGEGSALAVLPFVIVMVVSFLYIRFIGGNLRTMAEE